MHAIKVIDKGTLQKSRAKQKVIYTAIYLVTLRNKNS
jgi:hypothetical protein